MGGSLHKVRRGLYRRVVFPAAVALRGETGMYDALHELEDLQWASTDELRRRQTRRLEDILDHAFRQVPYYRDTWDIEEIPPSTGVLDLLRRLPLVTKKALQERADDLVADDPPLRTIRKTTGGSTGQPVTVLKNSDAVARERAASWLAYGWNGVEIGDRGARFWGSPTNMGVRRLRFALADLVMNRLRFSAFAYSDEDLEVYWQKCLRARPDYFYGYVSMLTEFARHLQSRGHEGRRLDLKLVITTSEALTEPQRTLLESVFGAPVQNEYGCGEVGPIAYECPRGSLHLMSENVLVEVLTSDGRRAAVGESGEVVVTDLNNRAMPLIRYRVGDRAVIGESCSCGRGFPVLERVWGRAYDFVRDRDGRRYHGEYFMYLFEDLRDRGATITQFRVTQETDRDLRFEIVAPDTLGKEHATYLRSRLGQDMPGMKVTIDSVSSIERASSGKTRVIRNPWLSDGGSE